MAAPHDPFLELAYGALTRDQPEKALEYLEQSQGLESSWFWWIRGWALFDLGRYQEALGAAQQGLTLEQTATFYNLLAVVRYYLGDVEGTDKTLLSALNDEPENVLLLLTRADLLLREGQLVEAEGVLSRLRQLAPDSTQVLRLRVLLARKKNSPEAEKLSRELLGKDPDASETHFLHGLIQNRRGDVDTAARHFREAARLEPDKAHYIHAARESKDVPAWMRYPERRSVQLTVFGISFSLMLFAVIADIKALYLFAFPVFLAQLLYPTMLLPLIRSFVRGRPLRPAPLAPIAKRRQPTVLEKKVYNHWLLWPLWSRLAWLNVAVPVLGVAGFIVFLILGQGQIALWSLRVFLFFEMYVIISVGVIAPWLKKRFQARSKVSE